MHSGIDGYRIMERELCQALVQAGKLDAGGLDRAIRLQSNASEGLLELLPRLGLISERDLAEAIARQLGLPLVGQRDDGMMKALAGEMTIEEVLKVTRDV